LTGCRSQKGDGIRSYNPTILSGLLILLSLLGLFGLFQAAGSDLIIDKKLEVQNGSAMISSQFGQMGSNLYP